MLFNTLDFALFFVVVFALYWLLNSTRRKLQNILILFSSYFFYACWDYRFLSLIVLSSFVDYFLALKIESEVSKRRKLTLLVCSVCFNLGLLACFKYFNFFIENFNEAFSLFGLKMNISSLDIIIPVGISFYTFQTMSYTIDVYRSKIKATKDIISFFSFVAFFPQLVAGPIERALDLLPQFQKNRNFEYSEAILGMKLILWGLFKKVVIADLCAPHVNYIFDHSDNLSSPMLILGIIYFAFQIYGDFSGYSDIAIGSSKLLGFKLKRNFNYPYFSRNIAEFWRRWHISLSSWFRDYVYIPLGGNRGSRFLRVRNVIIVFLVSGFWHGANWTFVIWGGIHSILFLPFILISKLDVKRQKGSNDILTLGFRNLILMLLNFALVCFAWIFFRSENVFQAFQYINGIFSGEVNIVEWTRFKFLAFIMVMLIVEWFNRQNEVVSINLGYRALNWLLYSLVAWLIMYYSFKTAKIDFIYFQF